MKKIYIMMAVFLLVGCTGTTQYMHTPSDSDGKVHLYRISEFNAGGMGAVFYVDDQNILKLGTKDYAEVPVAPGKHTISVKADQTTQKDTHELNVEPNVNYYFMIKANPNRLGPQLLIPLIEIASIPGFLLVESNEENYKKESAGFKLEKIEYANKASKKDAQ